MSARYQTGATVVSMPPNTGDGDSFLPPTPEELTQLAQVRSEAPAPVRRGKLGGCGACHQAAAAHWDAAGRFLGCPAAGEDTVFILWPAGSVGPRRVAHQGDRDRHRAKPAREFQRARYRTRLDKDVQPSSLTLSPQRKQVLTAIHEAGDEGIIAREIETRTGLPNGSVQQAARWLRDHTVIDAVEDTATDGEG